VSDLPDPILQPGLWWTDQEAIKGLDKAYRLSMGVPEYVPDQGGQVEIHFNQEYHNIAGWGRLMVRIRVDGYEARFPHDGSLRIPPPSEWVKMPIPEQDPDDPTKEREEP
jgi:hypothetical protein